MILPILLFLSLISATIADEDYYGGGGPPGRPRPPPRPARGSRCPNGWMLFKRPQGNWCVGLYIGLVTQPVAETRCRGVGATLTGLQNDQERKRLASAGQQMALKHNFGDAAIWLGARRKGSCPRAGICQPRETFFWTDNHTTGNAGFGWSPGQPDGVSSYTLGVQACAHQFVFASGTTHPRWPGIPHGALDDQYCQEGRINPNRKLFACGKKAV
ncbi:hypothetical protein GCK72_003520 [Caenorhabditis remanei]|uniref:C-type lectin domain-containing protein n=1 Tax=Caenorhabditis remanei TaxID=31234 RepID=A0A6A5HYD4_CAERE|nr:hypothetical protein GCK72_003520 [Caenorhabditis remanei]KAF1771693.1 hypothetical protein GCK72_003520 [Caenorhabditis remanei]